MISKASGDQSGGKGALIVTQQHQHFGIIVIAIEAHLSGKNV